jgi:carboxymethylenebutenolidase
MPMRSLISWPASDMSYFVLMGEFDATNIADITATFAALRPHSECTGKVGALGFGHGGKLAYLCAARAGADCAVAFYGSGIDAALDLVPRINCPLVMHFAENPHVPAEAVERIKATFAASSDVATWLYTGIGREFARPDNADFDKPAAGLAHSRSIARLRRRMGPQYDLEALWEKHTLYEFGTRDVAARMRTMVAEPYVNHIPVMTGGVGGDELARFYAHHFILKCPADFKLTPISRTVGADRLVDKMLVSFTHDVEIDWMLRGCPRRASMSRCRQSRSSISAATSSVTKTFIGIRRVCWFRLACSTLLVCRSLASKLRKSSSMGRALRTPLCDVGQSALAR